MAAKRMTVEDRVNLVWGLLLYKISEATENWVTLEQVRGVIIDTGLSPNSKKSINNVLEVLQEKVLEQQGLINTIVEGELEQVLIYKPKENDDLWQKKQ